METELEVREGLLSESSSEVDQIQHNKGHLASIRKNLPRKTSLVALLVMGSILSVAGVFFVALLVTGGMGFTGYVTPGSMLGRLPSPVNTTWDGWENLEYLIMFGDSYTAASFDPKGAQPNETNPFGNPPTALEMHTVTYWGNWLTYKYNASFIRTYNFADGGAVLDARLEVALGNHVENSLSGQILTKYLPLYLTSPSRAVWQGRNTLHTFFFGINDLILRSMAEVDKRHENKEYLESYMRSIDQVYRSGARTFLVLTVPPFFLINDPDNTALGDHGQFVRDWNSEVVMQIPALMKAKYPDATIYIFDTYALYTAVMHDPTSIPETAGLKNVGHTCLQYGSEMDVDAFNPVCTYPIKEYMWINGLHPTYPIMQATAARVVSDCFGANRIGFCS